MKESFFAICYSAQKRVSVWEKIDIDFILQYQSGNFGHIPVNKYFSIDELPKFVKIHDHVFESLFQKRECSAREPLYLLMSELWLRKTFSKVIFLNSNVSEKPCRMFCSKEDLEDIPGDSTYIY